MELSLCGQSLAQKLQASLHDRLLLAQQGCGFFDQIRICVKAWLRLTQRDDEICCEYAGEK